MSSYDYSAERRYVLVSQLTGDILFDCEDYVYEPGFVVMFDAKPYGEEQTVPSLALPSNTIVMLTELTAESCVGASNGLESTVKAAQRLAAEAQASA